MIISTSKTAPLIWKRNGGKDITLNVSLKDLLIRFGLTIFIPIVVLLINVHWVIFTAPIIAYLFVTTLTRFCLIKYLWIHYVMKQRMLIAKDYGQDPNYPEETV